MLSPVRTTSRSVGGRLTFTPRFPDVFRLIDAASNVRRDWARIRGMHSSARAVDPENSSVATTTSSTLLLALAYMQWDGLGWIMTVPGWIHH